MWSTVILALALPWLGPVAPEPPAEMAWLLTSVSFSKVEDHRDDLKPFPGEGEPLHEVRFPHLNDGLKPFPSEVR